MISFKKKMQEMAEEEERQRKRDERDGTVLSFEISQHLHAAGLLDRALPGVPVFAS